jgi:hypothetical protein
MEDKPINKKQPCRTIPPKVMLFFDRLYSDELEIHQIIIKTPKPFDELTFELKELPK